MYASRIYLDSSNIHTAQITITKISTFHLVPDHVPPFRYVENVWVKAHVNHSKPELSLCR